MSLPQPQLRFFADFIRKELGILYTDANYFQLEQRLERIAKMIGAESGQALYLKAARDGIDGHFRQCLLDVATNNETSFFRDATLFRALESRILPSLQAEFPSTALFRIWSAAASFGQEAYSMAMLVHELLLARPKHPRFEILTTDISDAALQRVKEARYSQLEVQRGLSAQRLVSYFTKDAEDHWSLRDDIRRLVQSRKQNLLDSFAPLGGFHLLLCRYVLIYQDQEKKKEIIQRLVQSLYPGGYLILGASESALGISPLLEPVHVDGAIFYRRKAGA